MKNDFIFREANIKDLEGILKLNFRLLKREYKKFDKSLDLNWVNKEGRKCFRNKIINKDGFMEVIESKEKIIGYLCGGISEGLSYRKKAKYATLENMLVEKKFRSKKLGTKLTNNFINWCKKNKINYISTSASAGNKSTINFYRKNGFKDYELTLEIKLDKKTK